MVPLYFKLYLLIMIDLPYLGIYVNPLFTWAGVSLSSDFIAGFCGEKEEDHLQTLSLIGEVGYNVGFLFAYSMRKVGAMHTLYSLWRAG